MAEKAYEEQFDGMAGWITKLEKEHDNLRSALDWANDHYPNDYRWLSGSLGWFWNIRGYYSLGKIHLKDLWRKLETGPG